MFDLKNQRIVPLNTNVLNPSYIVTKNEQMSLTGTRVPECGRMRKVYWI